MKSQKTSTVQETSISHIKLCIWTLEKILFKDAAKNVWEASPVFST